MTLPRRLPPDGAERVAVVVQRFLPGAMAGQTRHAQPVDPNRFKGTAPLPPPVSAGFLPPKTASWSDALTITAGYKFTFSDARRDTSSGDQSWYTYQLVPGPFLILQPLGMYAISGQISTAAPAAVTLTGALKPPFVGVGWGPDQNLTTGGGPYGVGYLASFSQVYVSGVDATLQISIDVTPSAGFSGIEVSVTKIG